MNSLLSYADPSTTALVLQIVAGVLVTLGAIMAIWWRKVVTFFKSVSVKLFGKKKNQEGSTVVEIDEELTDISDSELNDSKLSDSELTDGKNTDTDEIITDESENKS